MCRSPRFGRGPSLLRWGTVRPRHGCRILSTKRGGLVEILPNLLEDKVALKFKSRELALYVAGLDRTRFYEKKYLEGIKADLEKHRLLYWKRLDVTVTIQARLGLAVPQRIRDFYHSDPLVSGCICHVVVEGSNCKPWVVRCGDSVGEHGSEKVARMIAIIRRRIDPSFDPEGDSPPPPPTYYVGAGKRKLMMRDENEAALKKRVTEFEETM